MSVIIRAVMGKLKPSKNHQVWPSTALLKDQLKLHFRTWYITMWDQKSKRKKRKKKEKEKTRHPGLSYQLKVYLIFFPVNIKVKLATIVEGDPKAPFSIATTPRCMGGRYSIPRIAPLYPWTVPYNAEC